MPKPELRRERRIAVRAIGVMSASVIAFSLFAGPAQAATYPYPKPSRTLPAALDVAAPYQEGTRCLTENQPGAVAFAKLLNATYGTRTYGILRRCAAEHGEGRALDWMIDASNTSQRALANALTTWLVAPDAQGRPGAMARRFGINYIIWNRHIWKAWSPERGWVDYSGVSPHTDHIHFSFNWDGAYQRTSWWSGVAVTTPLTGPTGSTTTPPPVPTPLPPVTASGYPLLGQGATGADVALAQKVIGVSADGSFGPLTAAALGTWQSSHAVPATKKLDDPTWSTMVHLKLIPARSNRARPYANVVLRRGSTGAAVKALQKALGTLTADGSYGPATENAVEAFQKARGLAVSGVTDADMWKALMASAAVPATRTGLATEFTAVRSTSLKVGSRGAAVKVLHRGLPGLVVDGSFGPRKPTRRGAVSRSR